MDILIIGHSVEDHIFFRNQLQERKPGGIFYSATAFRAFAEPEDELFLVTLTEDNNYHLFENIYKQVNLQYSSRVKAIPKNHLMVFDDKERHEKYEFITEKIDIKVKDFSRFSGIYVNMITGFDVSLDDVKYLKENFSGPMFIDVHTLSRGIEPNYARNFRRIPDFDERAKAFDIIQVNENELLTLSDMSEEAEIAEHLFSLGVSVLIITKGEKGVTLYSFIDGLKQRFSLHAVKVNTLNRIGCGDMFGSVFFYYYLKTKDLIKSLELANTAAGCLASYSNLDKLKYLKEDVCTRYNKEKNTGIRC